MPRKRSSPTAASDRNEINSISARAVFARPGAPSRVFYTMLWVL